MPYASLYNIFITLLDNFILKNQIDKRKQTGALIQQLFDEKVLNIETKAFNFFDKPKDEIIQKYKNKYLNRNNNLNDLKNWYAKDISKASNIAGQIIAQRVNSWWDSSLRKSYQTFLMIISITLAIIMFTTALLQEASLNNFILNFAIPLLPIFNFLIREYNEVKSSNEMIAQLHASICSTYDSAITDANIVQLKKEIESNQLMILKHRINGVLTMDWFYKLFKKGYEDEMTNNVRKFVKDLSHIGD